MRGACESRTAEQGTHPRRTRPQCPTAPKRMHGACATECAARAAKHCRQCSARAQCAAVGSHLQRCRQAACLRSPARDKLAKRQRFTANLQPGCRAQLQESRRVCPPWPRVSGRPPRRAVLACSTLSILGPTWAAAACRATQRAYRGRNTATSIALPKRVLWRRARQSGWKAEAQHPALVCFRAQPATPGCAVPPPAAGGVDSAWPGHSRAARVRRGRRRNG